MLGDLIDVKHGFAFPGKHIHEEPMGDVLLTPGNFEIGGGFKADKFKYYDGPVPEEFVLREGDLLIAMTDLSKQSDTLGFPAFVALRSDGRRYLHNQRLGKVVIKDEAALDRRYLHYLLCSEEYRYEVLASATGTTVKHTSPDRIKRFLETMLSPVDDRIENLAGESHTLAALRDALLPKLICGELRVMDADKFIGRFA